jgi:hypothetical protein
VLIARRSRVIVINQRALTDVITCVINDNTCGLLTPNSHPSVLHMCDKDKSHLTGIVVNYLSLMKIAMLLEVRFIYISVCIVIIMSL